MTGNVRQKSRIAQQEFFFDDLCATFADTQVRSGKDLASPSITNEALSNLAQNGVKMLSALVISILELIDNHYSSFSSLNSALLLLYVIFN